MPASAQNHLESILIRERRAHRMTLIFVACVALIAVVSAASL